MPDPFPGLRVIAEASLTAARVAGSTRTSTVHRKELHMVPRTMEITTPPMEHSAAILLALAHELTELPQPKATLATVYDRGVGALTPDGLVKLVHWARVNLRLHGPERFAAAMTLLALETLTRSHDEAVGVFHGALSDEMA